MASFSFTSDNAEKVKTKFLRKYRDLSSEQLDFVPGKEEELVLQIMDLVKRDRAYVEFTLKKALAEPESNRL